MNLIRNPISVGIKSVWRQFKTLEFSPVKFIPSLIMGTVLGLSIIILVVVWPYGLLAVIEDMLRRFIMTTSDEMVEKSLFEKVPYVITIGLYCLVWLPFIISLLPFLIIGVVGQVIRTYKKMNIPNQQCS